MSGWFWIAIFSASASVRLCAAAVGCYILFTAWNIARGALDLLMDRELPDEERERIKSIVRGHSEVSALHELKTRKAGLSTFIQVHIELDPAMALARAHAISDAVEADLCAAWPHAEVIIHQDPAGLEQVAPTA